MTALKHIFLSPIVIVLALSIGLAGCGLKQEEFEEENPFEEGPDTDFSKRDSIFGTGSLNLLDSGGGSEKGSADGGSLGVNSFLWRASLDTISFMPVSSADPFGGVIITDWHSTTGNPNERFKMNVYILGRSLRADGLRVAVFSQVKDQRIGWRDAQVPTETSTRIEDAILTRARQLRRQTLQSQEQK